MELEKLEEEYKRLYPEVMKLYGPYVVNGRKQITIKLNNSKITSKQYAKILLEVKLNRKLGRTKPSIISMAIKLMTLLKIYNF